MHSQNKVDITSISDIHMYMFDRELEITRREIGARLRELRKRKSLTQCELAKALGHNSSTRLNQIELGRTRLYAEELPILCEMLACTSSDIIGEHIEPNEDAG
ncbi:helix-turn-helix protein [Marivita geojedonensis]|nr:helix-turn-helix protein [Marivita geojedonensis]